MGQLGVDVEDLLGDACDHHRREVLSGHDDVLSVRGFHRTGNDGAWVVGVAVAKPVLESCPTYPT